VWSVESPIRFFLKSVIAGLPESLPGFFGMEIICSWVRVKELFTLCKGEYFVIFLSP
jgi:hypothetical protein